MNKSSLLELLAEVQRGAISPTEASERLASLPFEDLGHARIDHHRSLRTGLPEVIYAAGKSPAQTVEIFARMAATGVDVLTTRADETTAAVVRESFPTAEYNAQARTLTLRQTTPVPPVGQIAVPTSVGYGASFAGAAALLGMLNSCSPNVTVVNIDNGFGAAYTATLIARASHR